MDSIKIKSFNKTGNSEFEKLVEELCDTCRIYKYNSSKTQSLLKRIILLSKNSVYTEKLENAEEVENKDFNDRHEFGEYLVSKLKKCNFNQINNNVFLWNWLAAFYIEKIFSGRALEIQRFIYQRRFFYGKRHLIRTPWVLVRRNKENTKFCLSSPLHQSSNMCEQFISRMDLWKNKYVTELCNKLYYDPLAKRQKRGADDHRIKIDDRGRRHRRRGVLYPRFYKEILVLSKNKDVWDMSLGELHSMIKKEFDVWEDITAVKSKKNGKFKFPSWTTNETSVALFEYRKSEDLDELLKTVNEKHHKLSKIIRSLKNEHKEDFSKHDNFRNATGVWRKLRNFAAVDPAIEDPSLQDDHYSNLDKKLFLKYSRENSLNELRTVVDVIYRQNKVEENDRRV